MFGGGAGGRPAPAASTAATIMATSVDSAGRPVDPARGQDLEARTTLSFRDAVTGSTVTLQTAEGAPITTRIPPVSAMGSESLRGKVYRQDPGAEAGDLILTVTVGKHPVFGREVTIRPSTCPSASPRPPSARPLPCPPLDGEQVKVRIARARPAGGSCASGDVVSHSKQHRRPAPSCRRHRADAPVQRPGPLSRCGGEGDRRRRPARELFAKVGS